MTAGPAKPVSRSKVREQGIYAKEITSKADQAAEQDARRGDRRCRRPAAAKATAAGCAPDGGSGAGERIPRISRLMALAIKFEDMIGSR